MQIKKPQKGRSVEDRCPSLVEEWSPSNKYKPSEVSCGSSYKPLWLCPKGHPDYQASCSNRTKKVNPTGCPLCWKENRSEARRKPKKGKSLGDLYPELIKEWSNKNELTPFDVKYGSANKYWWICPAGHEDYEMNCSSRTGKSKSGCPECRYTRSAKKLSTPDREESLGIKYPDLVPEWSDSNDKSIFEVYPYSDYTAHWVCRYGHEWGVKCSFRIKGTGCPKCSQEKRKIPPKEKSLGYLYPELLKEWSNKNKLSPFKVYAGGSSKKFYWTCPNGHPDYVATCKSRTSGGSGCPKCKYVNQAKLLARSTPGKSVGDLFPHLIPEWSPKNSKSVFEVSHGSSQIVLWVCSHNHEWLAKVYNRTKLNGSRPPTGCPKCINWATSKEETKLREELTPYGALPEIYKIGKWDVDIYIPSRELCIEYDGALWHESEEAVSRDRRKSLELLSLGYNVARVRTELGKNKLPSLEIDDPNYLEIFCKENSIRIAEQVVKTLVLQPNNI